MTTASPPPPMESVVAWARGAAPELVDAGAARLHADISLAVLDLAVQPTPLTRLYIPTAGLATHVLVAARYANGSVEVLGGVASAALAACRRVEAGAELDGTRVAREACVEVRRRALETRFYAPQLASPPSLGERPAVPLVRRRSSSRGAAVVAAPAVDTDTLPLYDEAPGGDISLDDLEDALRAHITLLADVRRVVHARLAAQAHAEAMTDAGADVWSGATNDDNTAHWFLALALAGHARRETWQLEERALLAHRLGAVPPALLEPTLARGDLLAARVDATPAAVPDDYCYVVPFEEALPLVRRRGTVLVGGCAYVHATSLAEVAVERFARRLAAYYEDAAAAKRGLVEAAVEEERRRSGRAALNRDPPPPFAHHPDERVETLCALACALVDAAAAVPVATSYEAIEGDIEDLPVPACMRPYSAAIGARRHIRDEFVLGTR